MRACSILAALALLVSVMGSACARDLPAPVYPVRDDVGVLDPRQLKAVQGVCVGLERETSAEIGVLIIDSTQGENAHDFAVRVYNAWGIGKAGRNNGVLAMFAMSDRRVEIVPGDGFRTLFSESSCQRLLKKHVVPRLRAGEPGGAVEACVEELARVIRKHLRLPPVAESLGDEDFQLLNGEFGGGARAPPARPPRPAHTSSRRSPAASGVHASGSFRGRTVQAALLLGVGLAVLVFLLWWTFSQGRLLLPKPLLYLTAIGWGAAVVCLCLLGQAPDTPEFTVAGAGGIGGLIICAVARHICPACSKWMSIRSVTVVAATYSSSGTGKRTYHCEHCLYHKVETYTIARKTRSSSSSSSSSSWSSGSSWSSSSSGGSFGGGYSSGGGGGASW